MVAEVMWRVGFQEEAWPSVWLLACFAFKVILLRFALFCFKFVLKLVIPVKPVGSYLHTLSYMTLVQLDSKVIKLQI